MISYEQRQSFESCYSFIDFAKATGLKAPIVSIAFTDFRNFALQYVKVNGHFALSECFSVWSAQTGFIN